MSPAAQSELPQDLQPRVHKLSGEFVAWPDTPEWRAARQTGIGASEAAAACGVSPWRTARELYALKTGELTPEAGDSDDQWFGRQHEPTIAAAFTRFVGLQVLTSIVPILRHEFHEFMLATPDAVVDDLNLAEWKATRIQRAAKLRLFEGDTLPEECSDWILQAQQQMAVTGVALVWFGVLIDGFTFRAYRCERNERLIDLIVDAERELWERIQRRDPPEPDWTHPRDQALVRELFTSVDGTRVECDAQMAEWWAEYERLGREIRSLTQQRDALKAQFLYRLGNNYAAVLPGGQKMVRRVEYPATEVSYTRKAYIDCRAVKYDGGPTAKLIESAPAEVLDALPAESLDDLFYVAELKLWQFGFLRYATSEVGSSRYYVHQTQPLRVRLSDHPPNAKTAARMDDEWIDVRTDLGRHEFDAALTLACACAGHDLQAVKDRV